MAVTMKQHPEGFTPSRVPMHGEGPTGWWSGQGHELTCGGCGWSVATRYAVDARRAAEEHRWQEQAEASARGELWDAAQVAP